MKQFALLTLISVRSSLAATPRVKVVLTPLIQTLLPMSFLVANNQTLLLSGRAKEIAFTVSMVQTIYAVMTAMTISKATTATTPSKEMQAAITSMAVLITIR